MGRLILVAVLALLVGCGPKNQEECIARAAKDAQSVAALNLLAANCQRDFPAKRRDDGSYAYYDAELGDWVTVSGPTLSDTDLQKIRTLRAEK